MKHLLTQNTLVNTGKDLDEGSKKAFQLPLSEVTGRLENYGIERDQRGLNLFP